MSWTLLRLRQALCALRHHDAILHLERDRISLRCMTCGYETPGWQLDVEDAGGAAGRGDGAQTVRAAERPRATARPFHAAA